MEALCRLHRIRQRDPKIHEREVTFPIKMLIPTLIIEFDSGNKINHAQKYKIISTLNITFNTKGIGEQQEVLINSNLYKHKSQRKCEFV